MSFLLGCYPLATFSSLSSNSLLDRILHFLPKVPGEGECLEFIWHGKYQSVVMAFRITGGLLRDADLHTLATWDCCVRLLFLLGLRQVVVLLHHLRNVCSAIYGKNNVNLVFHRSRKDLILTKVITVQVQ